MAMTDIERIKTLVGVAVDEQTEARLQIYIDNAKKAICVFIGKDVTDFPDELSYIVDAITLAKYNKFHNEGMNSISEAGLSMTFNANDLQPYYNDLQAWLDRNTGLGNSGIAVGWE